MINPKMINNQLHFTDDSIIFKQRSILLNGLPITDQNGKKMLVEGNLNFPLRRDPNLQLKITADSMQIIDIPDRNINPIFGKIVASNLLTIQGPLKSPDIGLNIRLIKGTDFTFRITENLSSYEGEGVINFMDTKNIEDSGSSLSEKSVLFKPQETGIELDAKVKIDPDTRLRLKYAENMDFDIALSGNGDISYKTNRTGEESMFGLYAVTDGHAILKLQGLAPKNFTISPQSYMRWDGLVDNPLVDIRAYYRVKGSYQNPASGMTNAIIVDYDVMFAFKNRLNKPDIIFDLQTEDQYMTTVLNAMPPEERIKQAINVLLLGYIVTPETKASGSKIISDHINQFWTQQLNSAADKSLGGVEVTVDIQTITDYSAGNAQDQTNFSYEVKKDIWNDRATVKVGGYVRTYTSSPQDATSRMIGDFSLEYKLNEKGNLYGKLFSQNKYEGILEGEIQRTGIGILYRQNYQSMSEIWERRKKRKNEKQNEK
jgi:translocation and assembly module TamB